MQTCFCLTWLLTPSGPRTIRTNFTGCICIIAVDILLIAWPFVREHYSGRIWPFPCCSVGEPNTAVEKTACSLKTVSRKDCVYMHHPLSSVRRLRGHPLGLVVTLKNSSSTGVCYSSFCTNVWRK